MDDTSLSLLDRLGQSGNNGSWQRLVELYSPLLRGWLARYEVQAADVDDLLQDVLVVVMRELPRFSHNKQPGAFRNWLRRVMVNRLRDHWRSKKYRPMAGGGSSWADRLEQLADDSSHASYEWNLEHDRHVMSRLFELVRPRFEPKTWEAFQLQMFAGKRADVVAAELGIPLNSVYVARSRVLSALRREAAGLIDD